MLPTEQEMNVSHLFRAPEWGYFFFIFNFLFSGLHLYVGWHTLGVICLGLHHIHGENARKFSERTGTFSPRQNENRVLYLESQAYYVQATDRSSCSIYGGAGIIQA